MNDEPANNHLVLGVATALVDQPRAAGETWSWHPAPTDSAPRKASAFLTPLTAGVGNMFMEYGDARGLVTRNNNGQECRAEPRAGLARRAVQVWANTAVPRFRVSPGVTVTGVAVAKPGALMPALSYHWLIQWLGLPKISAMPSAATL